MAESQVRDTGCLPCPRSHRCDFLALTIEHYASPTLARLGNNKSPSTVRAQSSNSDRSTTGNGTIRRFRFFCLGWCAFICGLVNQQTFGDYVGFLRGEAFTDTKAAEDQR